MKPVIDDPEDPILEGTIRVNDKRQRDVAIPHIRNHFNMQAWPEGDYDIGLRGPKSAWKKLALYQTN